MVAAVLAQPAVSTSDCALQMEEQDSKAASSDVQPIRKQKRWSKSIIRFTKLFRVINLFNPKRNQKNRGLFNLNLHCLTRRDVKAIEDEWKLARAALPSESDLEGDDLLLTPLEEDLFHHWFNFLSILVHALKISFRSFFSPFKGMRYRCTTMPWTIWPSLLVLWGVCWMFYGSPEEYISQGDITDTTPDLGYLNNFDGEACELIH